LIIYEHKKPAAKAWQRVFGIADVAFSFAYISRQRNTAARIYAPPVPGGVDCAAVVIGRFHLVRFEIEAPLYALHEILVNCSSVYTDPVSYEATECHEVSTVRGSGWVQ
jgi:hypothetical protein